MLLSLCWRLTPPTIHSSNSAARQPIRRPARLVISHLTGSRLTAAITVTQSQSLSPSSINNHSSTSSMPSMDVLCPVQLLNSAQSLCLGLSCSSIYYNCTLWILGKTLTSGPHANFNMFSAEMLEIVPLEWHSHRGHLDAFPSWESFGLLVSCSTL